MKFYYAFRKREFDSEWKYIEKMCLAEGIPAADIAKAKEQSWSDVKSDRRFAMHTAAGVDYESIIIDPASDYSSGGTRIAVEYDFFDSHSRHWWIENPSNSQLSQLDINLNDYEKELLTLRFKDNYTLEEMEEILGTPSVTIWRQLGRLLKSLRSNIEHMC